MKAVPKVSIRPESLRKGISALEARFRRAMRDSRRLDRVRGFGGLNTPYGDFAPALERQFERARLAFDREKLELARDAYSGLFAILALKDDYGFAIDRPKSLVILYEQARYLRTLGQKLKMAFSESISKWKPAPAKVSAKVVEGCSRLVRSAIAAALKSPNRVRMDRAALLAASVAETLRERRSAADAVEFVEKLVRTHKRRPEFAEALRLRWHPNA